MSNEGNVAIDTSRLRHLLNAVQSGDLAISDAMEALRALPFEDLGFAKVDHHRALRQGFPEVIFGQGKTPEQVVAIAQRITERADRLLITRIGPEAYEALQPVFPDAVYHPLPRTITWRRGADGHRRAGIVVACAGTADLPVAEEAALTAELMDNAVERICDVGVAGLHRLLDYVPLLQSARVVVVVAGMDGALPSVIGGLVSSPVIAVPTSVGYGANFGGLAPLLTMLNSCAAGVSVVNIDNGFGAGYLAAMINRIGTESEIPASSIRTREDNV